MNLVLSGNRSRFEAVVVRIGLVSTTLVLFARAYDLWIFGQSPLYPLSLVLSFAAWGFGICLVILALRRDIAPTATWLILAGLIFAFLAAAYVHLRNAHPLVTPRTDNQMIGEFAVQALRRGINPYQWDFSDFRRVYHDLLNFTGFLDGSFQRRVTYPSLPTLLLLGLDFVGLGSIKLVSVIAHVAVLVLLFAGSPPVYRPVILLPLFLWREFSFFPLAGLQDVFWCALLLGMILAWDRPISRAVLFGLACSYRQQPWLIAPFLVISLWHEGGSLRERILRVGDFGMISGGVFLVVNLPFLFWDPVAWGLGAFEPSFATFNVWSQGIGALSQFGLVPWTRTFYTIVQLSFYVSALFLYWRHPRAVRYVIWVVPAFFFWIYYRALANYWLYWIPPLLLLLARSQERGSLVGPGLSVGRVPGRRPASWKPTVAILGVVAVANLVLAVVLAFRPPTISADYRLPLQTTQDLDQQMVTQVEIELTNQSDQVLTPRFSVQREQPYPWLIESGPEMLQPGESGIYVARAGYPAVAFPASEGAQIVVTDGSSDYKLREEVDIPPDPTFQDPDRVVNPQYKYWSDTEELPAGWAYSARPEGEGTVQMEQIDGRDALVLRTTAPGSRSYLRLSQTITFPGAFDIWVYPTAPVSSPLHGSGYGLEFFDGANRIRVLFGNTEGRGFLDAHTAYVSVPAPVGEWSLQRVTLDEIYQELGLSLPPVTRRVQNNLSFQARQVDLSLLLVSDRSEGSMGVFGAIEQPPVQRVGSTDYLEQALQDPAEYYVGLGNEYREQRNYNLALEAYETALSYTPDRSDAYWGLGVAYTGMRETQQAVAALEESLRLGFPYPEHLIADAFFDVGEACFWQGEWQEAIAAYQRALDLGFERSFMAYKGQGWAYYNLEELMKARLRFAQAIRAIPSPGEDDIHRADALSGLGWVAVEEEDCETALSLFRRALTLAPNLGSAQEGLLGCSSGP